MILLLGACLSLSNEALRPALVERDSDGDGFSPAEGDCDDANPAAAPDAAELAYNQVDDDCTPETPDDDLDGDGWDHAADCDDTWPASWPGAHENCTDGRDTDCDGDADDLDEDCALPGDGYREIVLLPVDPRDDAAVCWGSAEGLDCRDAHAGGSGVNSLGDVDGDLVPELLVGPFNTFASQICPIDGYRLACTDLFPGRSSYTGDGDGELRLGDLDGDGLVDVVVPGTTYGERAQACLQVVTGGYSCADLPFAHAATVSVVDVDQDGDLDLASVNRSSAELVWCENDGAAGFDACVARPGGEHLWATVEGIDLDGDGIEELVLDEEGWSECRGVGEARLDACTQPVPDCGPPVYVDADGRGDLDVLCVNEGTMPRLCLGDGAGGYTCADAFGDRTLAFHDATLADLDDDGVLELVASSALDLLVCSQTGVGRWEACERYATPLGYYTFGLAISDLGAPP
ncbi:MAG: VCBS repeat-containing protein [Myxococcota bacterium]